MIIKYLINMEPCAYHHKEVSNFRLGMDAKLLATILNMSSGQCWSSLKYNPCPGVLENVPSSNDYLGGFGTALMAKVYILFISFFTLL